MNRTPDDVRTLVRERYGKIAIHPAEKGCGCSTSCCGGEASPSPETVEKSRAGGCGCDSGCCSEKSTSGAAETSLALGYSASELSSAPQEANLGLGCGNPQTIASLKPGETVLDLGSGGGLDSFLAARQVGPAGRVIGVDMTPQMIDKARGNARKEGHTNVEFRLGEIENLPIADKSVDVIISNCVINLSPEKEKVYREAFRVLKPGGRLAVSDVVATVPVPDDIREDAVLHTGCMAGASLVEDVEAALKDAGFTHVQIKPKDESRTFIKDWSPNRNVADYFVSATIEGVKPT